MIEKDRLYILLIDDDRDEYLLLKEHISALPRLHGGLSYKLDWVDTYAAGLQAFDEGRYDVYLVDYRLGEHNGLELLRAAADRGVSAPVILLTGQGSYDVDMAAMEFGAMDYLVKDGITGPVLERSIRYALDRKATQNELERLVAERTQKLAEANAELRAEITRRKEAEAVLRVSEAKFRALADTTSAAILIVQDGIIRYTNPATEFVTGFCPEELLGKNFVQLAHPTYSSILPSVLEAGAPVASRFELKIVRKNGEERWVDVTFGEMEFEDRPGWVITAFDITERDLAEKALRQAKVELEARIAERTDELRKTNAQLAATVTEAQQRAEELDALYNATAALLTTLDLETLLGKILDSAQSAISTADQALLCLLPSEGGSIQIHIGSGEHDARLQTSSGPVPGEILSAIEAGRPLLIRNIDSAGLDCEESVGSSWPGMCSLIVAPLILDGETLGALSLSARRPAAFSEAELRLLEGFAVTTTAAIQNARLYADVQRLAVTDSLTGQLNRRGFQDIGWREIERRQRYGHPLSAVLLDIDRFKAINDTYGHAAGDKVLRFVADRCSQNLRQVDILCRFGGDEFAILLPETDRLTAAGVAERIRQAVSSDPVIIWDDPEKPYASPVSIRVSVSLGVTQAVETTPNLQTLIEQADGALYEAKKNGSNRVAVG